MMDGKHMQVKQENYVISSFSLVQLGYYPDFDIICT